MILLYISKKKAAPSLPPMAVHFNPFIHPPLPKRGLECGITTSFCNTTVDSVAISVRRAPPQQQQDEEEGDAFPFQRCSICSPQCEVKAAGVVKDEEGLISNKLPTPGGGGEEKRRRIGDGGAFKIVQDEMWVRTQQRQMEIKWLLSQHVMEEERRRWWVRLLMEGGMVKRLEEMEEEVERVRERNRGLKEMVKCLNVEKEAWKEMAITNEAAVDMLKSSSSSSMSSSTSSSSSQVGKRMGKKKVGVGACRRCRGRASTVVVLPCKHLCLCHLCGSTVKRCPVCNCSRNMNVSVHVNLC